MREVNKSNGFYSDCGLIAEQRARRGGTGEGGRERERMGGKAGRETEGV